MLFISKKDPQENRRAYFQAVSSRNTDYELRKRKRSENLSKTKSMGNFLVRKEIILSACVYLFRRQKGKNIIFSTIRTIPRKSI